MQRFLLLLALVACSDGRSSAPDAGPAPFRSRPLTAATAGEDLASNEDYGILGGPAAVSYTGTAARSTQVGVGRYYITCSTDCWIARGDSSVAATAAVSGGEFLAAGIMMPVQVTPSDSTTRDYFSAIRDATSGTLRILPCNRRSAR